MADKKISQLTGATTPLAGTEVLPIVQGGSTVKVSVDNLTAGKAVSASSMTLSGGTAKGVLYLSDPAKVATSGTAFQFDGTNLRLGGAPSAWAFNVPSFDVGSYAAVYSAPGIQGGGFATNTFFDGSNWVYKTTDVAAAYSQGQGTHKFFRAVSDTAGNPVSLIGIMETDASDNLKLNAGNLVVGTAAKGIDFSANTGAAGMTSELLNWYEEGTWTPAITSNGGSITSTSLASGNYTRVGNQVTIWFTITITDNGTGSGYIKLTGMPFNLTSVGKTVGSGVEAGVSSKQLVIYGNSASELIVTFYDGTYPGATNAVLNGCVTYYV
jgi:hypothetical protein